MDNFEYGHPDHEGEDKSLAEKVYQAAIVNIDKFIDHHYPSEKVQYTLRKLKEHRPGIYAAVVNSRPLFTESDDSIDPTLGQISAPIIRDDSFDAEDADLSTDQLREVKKRIFSTLGVSQDELRGSEPANEDQHTIVDLPTSRDGIAIRTHWYPRSEAGGRHRVHQLLRIPPNEPSLPRVVVGQYDEIFQEVNLGLMGRALLLKSDIQAYADSSGNNS